MRDWNFTVGDDICALRASGVLIRDGAVLLQQDMRSREFALPGGHVQIGETTQTALVREFAEEMAVEIVVKKLISVGEVFWHWQGKRTSCLDLSYEIACAESARLAATAPQPLLDNPQVQLSWQPLDRLAAIDLQPSALTGILTCPLDTVTHYVSRPVSGPLSRPSMR